jgi:predicted TPR repeat methyltransferase
MTKKLEERLAAVYGAGGDRQRLDDYYDDWSTDYDADLWASGNPYVAIINGLVSRHVPDYSTRMLDAGCGSGLLGQVLYQTGYRNLDGLDASKGMLAAARAKGCYRNLHRLLLGASIELEPGTYDAVLAAGVLTHGHAPPESLDGILEIAAPGAAIIFSISQIAVDEGGFGEKMQTLESQGAWRPVERTEPFRTYPFSDAYADLRHWICVYRKRG